MDTHIADLLSAVLEALLNYDSGTFKSSSGFLYNIDQSEKSTAICKEIINKKYVILRTKELLGNNNIINFLMGKGFNLGAVHLAVQVYTLGFLGKYYRNMKILCCNTGNANTGSFNSEDLGDGAV